MEKYLEVLKSFGYTPIEWHEGSGISWIAVKETSINILKLKNMMEQISIHSIDTDNMSHNGSGLCFWF